MTNATLELGIILTACPRKPLYSPPLRTSWSKLGVYTVTDDGEERKLRYNMGILNLARCAVCIGYDTIEYAIDAEEPARMTNAGDMLQCGLRSFGPSNTPDEIGLWPP